MDAHNLACNTLLQWLFEVLQLHRASTFIGIVTVIGNACNLYGLEKELPVFLMYVFGFSLNLKAMRVNNKVGERLMSSAFGTNRITQGSRDARNFIQRFGIKVQELPALVAQQNIVAV